MIVTDLSNSFNPVPKIRQKSGQKRTESGQKEFKKYYKTENFVQIFGRNYLIKQQG